MWEDTLQVARRLNNLNPPRSPHLRKQPDACVVIPDDASLRWDEGVRRRTASRLSINARRRSDKLQEGTLPRPVSPHQHHPALSGEIKRNAFQEFPTTTRRLAGGGPGLTRTRAADKLVRGHRALTRTAVILGTVRGR